MQHWIWQISTVLNLASLVRDVYSCKTTIYPAVCDQLLLVLVLWSWIRNRRVISFQSKWNKVKNRGTIIDNLTGVWVDAINALQQRHPITTTQAKQDLVFSVKLHFFLWPFLKYLVLSDFGWVFLVLLVTWVIQTPNPLNSAKRPLVVYVSNLSLLAYPLLVDFGEGFFFFFFFLFLLLLLWQG